MDWYLLDLILPKMRRRIGTILDRLDPVMARVRHAQRRTLILAGGAALLLVVALIVTARSASDSDVPSDEFMGFYCPACDRHFELSHRQFKQLWDKHAFTRPAGSGSLLFKCTYCGKLTAVRADKPVTSQPASHGP